MAKIKPKKILSDIREYLTQKYGSVKPSWETLLWMLEEQLEIYVLCKKELENSYIFVSAENKKNSLLSTLKDCTATILKISQQLGISPWSESKIKPDEDDQTEDYIQGLVS